MRLTSRAGCARQAITTASKPVMYLFSQPWCGACKRLKADFGANGDALLAISAEFIMVNVHGDDNKKFGVRARPHLSKHDTKRQTVQPTIT